MSIPIIDTHVHIWDLMKVHYSWLQGDDSILARNYLPAELYPQLSKVHVTSAVLVQAANNLEDTELMLSAASQNDWIKGVVGWVPLQDPSKTQALIENWKATNTYLKGIRHLIHNEANENWLLQDSVIESLKILAHHHITYDIVGVKEAHLKAAITIAEKIPNLNLVLDHLNNPPMTNQSEMDRWRTNIKVAAQLKNIHAKISGLAMATGQFETWTSADIQSSIEYAIEKFGTDRCFCGGDWPVSLLAGGYVKTIQAYRTIIENCLPVIDQEKVFNKNAALFYQL
jgi:L-fuconolactonase